MTQREKRDKRTYEIISVAMEVHRQRGCGFLEAVYQEALALELAARAVPHKREVEFPVFTKGSGSRLFIRPILFVSTQ